jgi:hypothetical protein
VPLRLRQEVQAVLRRGDGELTSPSSRIVNDAFGSWAAGRERARHEGWGVVEYGSVEPNNGRIGYLHSHVTT